MAYSQPKGMPLLEAKGLEKWFHRRCVVRGVTLEVREREIVGLLGPNGAGKTTTFRMIIGALRPDKGSILFCGKDISRLAMHERARLGIGYLTQEPSIFRKLTVEENLLVALETRKVSRKERKELLASYLSELNLTHLAKSYAYTLSGGEKRRLEITRTLLLEPKVILLDEPFSGIDPITVYELQNILRWLRDRGLGILITDHNVRETLRLADRAYLIHQGEVICQGTAEFLISDQKAREIYLGPEFDL